MLVRRARRRVLVNELFSQTANAASAVLLALILLLLLGTEILNWRWLISLPLAAITTGLYFVRKRLPALYSVAQTLDHRLGLADTLSTALYFSQPAKVPKDAADICRAQREEADRLAQSADVCRAFPYHLPRTAYAMAALALVASSLFALRYGLDRRLDLKPPLARILEQTLGIEPKTEQARNIQKQPSPEAQKQQDENGEAFQDQQLSSGDRQDDSDNSADDSNQSQGTNGDSKKAADSKKQGDEGEKADAADKDGPGEERDGNDSNKSGNSGQQGKNQPNQKQDSAAKQDPNNTGENSSLMSKVKDAMQNLLSRMKPQNGQQGSQQQSSGEQKGSQGKGQQNGAKQQQQASRDGQQGESQDGQPSEQAQSAQDPQSKGTGKSDSAQSSKQPGSGIGSQDGDKNIRQAEQLAAMGKISEIFGKRSATISGESTVQVQNTSQQLHTPYAQRGVQHSQNGAEINRDEVPVALQAFVAQYFEQVRKQSPPKK